MIGFGFSSAGSRTAKSGGAPPAFDRASLALEGFWRAPYAGSPWEGAASAGGSDSRDLTEATNPPAIGGGGLLLNGMATAHFDGSNDKISGAASSTFMDVDEFTIWALVNPQATHGSVGQICGDSAGFWRLALGTATSNNAGLMIFDGGSKNVVTADLAVDAWSLIQARLVGGTLGIRLINSSGIGVWDEESVGDIGSLASNLEVGSNGSALFLNGAIAELALSKVGFDDTTLDAVAQDIVTTYALGWSL